MDLGISVEAVVKAKFRTYLDSLPEAEAKAKLQEYIDTAKDSIQGAIDEASGLGDSIQSTCVEITGQTPLIIGQIASLSTSIDPVGAASQMVTIATSVNTLKDQVKRANSQLISMVNIVTQLGVSSSAIKVLKNTLTAASNLLNTIPV